MNSAEFILALITKILIVIICGWPTHQLLTTALTDYSIPVDDHTANLDANCNLTENFIDAFKTVHIPDDYKPVSFDVKSLFTSFSPLQRTYRDRHPMQRAYCCTTVTNRRHHGPTEYLS